MHLTQHAFLRGRRILPYETAQMASREREEPAASQVHEVVGWWKKSAGNGRGRLLVPVFLLSLPS